jgi:hypothetical protein
VANGRQTNVKRALHAIGRRFARSALPLLVITFLLGVYLAAGNVLVAVGFPAKRTWAPWSGWFIALLIAAVWVPLYAFVTTIQARAGASQGLREGLKLECQQIVSSIAEASECVVDESLKVSVTELAACVWTCRGDGGFDEVARFYLPHDRLTMGVRWHKGKGVAGWAWAENKDLFVDLRTLNAMPTETFEALPAEKRFGLTAAELKDTSRYTGVGAVRLFSSDSKHKLLGMLIIDYVGETGFDTIVERAQSGDVTKHTGACARILTAGARYTP